MYSFDKLMKSGNNHQLLLTVVLIIYILADVQTPPTLANMIDSITGNVVIGLLALSIFANSNPMVGILGLVAAYMLVTRSSASTGSYAIKQYVPSENSKVMDFSKYNEFPVSLEEEVVERMAPLVKHDPAPDSNYKPVLGLLHSAAPADYDGVV